jgi:hypothetical protein
MIFMSLKTTEICSPNFFVSKWKGDESTFSHSESILTVPTEPGRRPRLSPGRSHIRSMGLLLALAVALAAGCGPTLKRVSVPREAVEIERQRQQEMAFSILMQRRDRQLNVFYPLKIAATELCGKDVERIYGIELHDKRSYGKEYERIAAQHYKLGDEVTVRYVYSKLLGPSEDLHVGDRILAINGQPLDGLDASKAIIKIRDIGRSRDQPLQLKIDRKGEVREVSLPGELACKTSIQLVNDDRVNAFADGRAVAVTTGMIRFTERDEELALVVGHEIAHNALSHVTKQRGNTLLGTILDIVIGVTTGVDTGGLFGGLTGLAFSHGFEAEADYAGLYIVARAGYDISNAGNVWRRMAVEHPGSIKSGGFLASHPSTPERFVAIENTVREIDEKRRQGQPLLPEKR